jgi:hypothetical protein
MEMAVSERLKKILEVNLQLTFFESLAKFKRKDNRASKKPPRRVDFERYSREISLV